MADAKPKITVWMDNNNPEGVGCTKLAAMYGYECEVKNITTKYSWKELREVIPNVCNVPQVFVGTKLVGGLAGLKRELNVPQGN